MTNAKKVLSLILATAMTLSISATAFAADPVAEPAPLQRAISAQTQKNPNLTVVSTEVQEVDGLTLYAVHYTDSRARAAGTISDFAIHSWFDRDTDEFLMDVAWNASFSYDGTTATCDDIADNVVYYNDYVSYTSLHQSIVDSSSGSSASATLKYKVNYNDATSTTTSKVSCTVKGVTSATSATKRI